MIKLKELLRFNILSMIGLSAGLASGYLLFHGAIFVLWLIYSIVNIYLIKNIIGRANTYFIGLIYNSTNTLIFILIMIVINRNRLYDSQFWLDMLYYSCYFWFSLIVMYSIVYGIYALFSKEMWEQ